MDKKQEIIAMIKDGYSHSQIEFLTGTPRTAISKIRNEAGMGVPSQNRKKFSKNTTIESTIGELKHGLKIGNGLEYKNGEVTTIEEELTQLENIIEKLKAKGIDIGGINYQGKQKHISKSLPPFLGGDKNNVLVIGDIHEPVSIDGYLEFCRKQQEKRNCGTVVMIGDIVDLNSYSYHEQKPEDLNPYGEIALAKQKLSDWYKTFPKVKVCRGNHDLLGYRKAKTAGLPREFIQGPHQMFGAPLTYEFEDEYIIDDVIYTHGNVGNAWKKTPIEGMSMVCGHHHQIAGVQWFKNRNKQIFGCQVGTGIDYSKSVFDYARISPKNPVLSCAVILDKGRLPIVLPFKKR